MRKTLRRVLAVSLSAVMAASAFSISAAAYNADYQSETHTVFKHTAQTLAPGVEYYNNYAMSSDNKQMVYYVTTADVTRDDVLCQVAYKDMQCENYGMSKLSEQVAVANAKYSDPENASLTEYEKSAYASENYAVVSACNGDGYNMTTGEPGGALILGGNIKKEWTKNASSSMFFAMLKDGRAVIGETKEEWDAYMADPGIAEAIDSFGGSAKLVWDGKDTTANASGSYNTDRHSRTMLGVTADGKVVIAVLDGRQEPFSCGGSMHELAQIMIEAGCDRAFNLDGGGSTTFMARMPGEDSAAIVNRPSDGSPRSISNGLIIATKAKVKDEVSKVVYSPETEYITPGTSIKIGTTTYDDENAPIARPDNLTFTTTGGTFENGIFTAPNETGDVTITAVSKGREIDQQVIHVVVPDSLAFNEYDAFFERLGSKTPITFTATYQGQEVTTKPEDFELAVTNTTANYEGEILGSFDGFMYVAPADTADNQTRCKTGTLTAKVKGTEVEASNAVKFTDTYYMSQGFETGGRYADPVEAYSGVAMPEFVTSEYVTAETGKVHSGNRSLAIHLDFTGDIENDHYDTGYMAARQQISALSANYGKKFGMWMYIPERIDAAFIRIFNGSANLVNLIDTGNLHHEKYDEGAWHYFEGDISGQKSFSYAFLEIYVSDRDGVNDGYYFKDATNVNKKFTLYIDDIGFDRTYGGYDMQDPIFDGVTAYTTSGGSAVDLGYQDIPEINASTVSITADVDDDRVTNPYTVSGLDYSSAKAYIDGVQVDASAANNTITIEDITLPKGVHTARFEIKDNEGAEAIIVRQFNITAGNDSALKLVSETDVNTKVNIGSVHWFDIVADDISKIQSADVALDLDCFNHWQDNRIETAKGFTHTAKVDEETNTLTLHIEKGEGAPENNVLARIPVKLWESYKDPTSLFDSKCFWPVAIEIKPVKTAAVLTDGSQTTFSFANIRIDSEIDGNYAKLLEEGYFDDGKTSWHQHTLEWINEPSDATCTHPGSHGTAYCSVCDDMVYYDEPVMGVHHYEWNAAQQKYLCKDCGKEAEGYPTIEASGTVGSFSDGVIEGGWVITEGEENNIFYLNNGAKVTGNHEVEMFDGSGTKMAKFSTTTPFNYTSLFTGGINNGDYKVKIYENGVLSTGEGDHLVTDGAKTWIANKDGENAYTGTAVGFYEVDGLTYCVYYGKTSTLQSTLNGCLWTGPLDYSKNTTATTDNYYIHGKQMEGWTCVSGAAHDADGNLVTGWRNADGTPATVDINDPETMVGKYCFGTDGKVKIGNTVVALTDDASENRYCSFGTKTSYLDNVGQCKGFYATNAVSGGVPYEGGYPKAGGSFFYTYSYYTNMYIDGVKVTGNASGIVPVRYTDGYYYNIKGTSGYVVSQYRLTSNYFTPTHASYNNNMDPWWIEARYTGVVVDTTNDKHGYAILGELFEGYTLTDGKVCDENGQPINRTFLNGFGDQVFYVDGVYMGEGRTFSFDGKAYTVVDKFGKAVPYNGIINGKYYIDGIESDNAVYAGKYVVKDGKVCALNEDKTIGEPVTGVIGDTYFEDGVATENQILDGKLLSENGKLYRIEDGQKGELFTGLYNETYYVDGVATEHQVLDGKYVFIDDILYNVKADGSLGARVSGTVEGTKYASGKPQNGWVADKYYYEDGKKVTGAREIDGKAYKFDNDGLLEGPYNGMLYDEAADVYRMYDQGVRINGSNEFGSCVDGVPVDGWYANEYYFVNGKYLTGVQEVDGFYYDFGEDGKGDSFTKYTGVFEKDGKYFYSQNGELSDGWKNVDDIWYYFGPDCSSVPKYNNGKVTFFFEPNGQLKSGQWYNDGNGYRYYYGPDYYRCANAARVNWQVINGETYAFDVNGYRYTGISAIKEYVYDTPKLYEFTDEGVLVGAYNNGETGFVKTAQNETYYVVDGELNHAGLIKVDGDYYYVDSECRVVSDCTKYIVKTWTNDLVPEGTYSFGPDGKMLNPPQEEPEVTYDNGIHEINGVKYYFKDGEKFHAGLIDVDGDFYYIDSECKVVTDCSKYIMKEWANNLVPEGTYSFDADGKMINKPVPEPVVEYGTGIYEINGVKYYFKDGEKFHAGLIDVDGDFYYIDSECKVAVNSTRYILSAWANNLVPEGTYSFDADGKMINKPVPEPVVDYDTGIYEINGVKYYFKDGEKFHAGMIDVDGELYYIDSECKVVTSCTRYVLEAWANDLVPEGTYSFDADGKLIRQTEPEAEYGTGIYEIDGVKYYFKDGEKFHAGMINVDGELYYIDSECKVVTNCTKYIMKAWANSLVPEGTYSFDADGKLIR